MSRTTQGTGHNIILPPTAVCDRWSPLEAGGTGGEMLSGAAANMWVSKPRSCAQIVTVMVVLCQNSREYLTKSVICGARWWIETIAVCPWALAVRRQPNSVPNRRHSGESSHQESFVLVLEGINGAAITLLSRSRHAYAAQFSLDTTVSNLAVTHSANSMQISDCHFFGKLDI